MEVTLTTAFIVGIGLLFVTGAAIAWKKYIKAKEKEEPKKEEGPK